MFIPVDEALAEEAAKRTGMSEAERKFFTHENIEKLAQNAGTRCAWDWNTTLGDTIKEKYESFYIKVRELTNVLIKKGAKGYFWIVAAPEVTSIFEVATMGFQPSSWGDQLPMGIDHVQYIGLVDRRFRIYADVNMQSNTVLIGANWDDKVDPKLCGHMQIANFVL